MADNEIVESLNKISSNLTEINNTIKKNQTEKVEELTSYEKMVQDLIQKIDNEKDLFTRFDELHGYSMTFYIIGLFLFLAFVVSYLPDSVMLLTGRITIVVAIAALLLTYLSYTSKGRENNVVAANFQKAIKKFKIEKSEEEKRIFLEALLMIKAITPSYKLAKVKEVHTEMFTKEKLLERLYE